MCSNTKMNIEETEWCGIDLLYLAQVMYNHGNKPLFSIECGDFLN